MLPEAEPALSRVAGALAEFLVASVQREAGDESRGRAGMLITTVNGSPVDQHPIARCLLDTGFQAAPLGFNIRRSLLLHPGRSATVPPAKEDGYAWVRTDLCSPHACCTRPWKARSSRPGTSFLGRDRCDAQSRRVDAIHPLASIHPSLLWLIFGLVLACAEELL